MVAEVVAGEVVAGEVVAGEVVTGEFELVAEVELTEVAVVVAVDAVDRVAAELLTVDALGDAVVTDDAFETG